MMLGASSYIECQADGGHNDAPLCGEWGLEVLGKGYTVRAHFYDGLR